MISKDQLERAIKSGRPDLIALAAQLLNNPLFTFRPRPDRPDLFDQQTSFFEDKFEGTACALGGNGSGKTWVGAAKVAKFLSETPPPEKNTPFWIMNQTMDLVTKNTWGQSLRHFIQDAAIQNIVWLVEKSGQPRQVILKPHANGNNYVLDFKSYDQNRESLQAANIAGFWLDEQCPQAIYREVLARTRKWIFPGSKLYTLTPLTPDPDPVSLQHIYEHQGEYTDWRFYRFNTRCNQALDPAFVKRLEENEVAALVETRLTGAFARFEGAVYPNFDTNVHVIDPIPLPRTWLHVRGLDLGWSHGTACVWAAKDQATGTYYVYREYLKTQTAVEEHVKQINEGWDALLVKGSTYADPAAAQTLHEFALRGLRTVQANKDIHAGIATVQSLLHLGNNGRPKLFIFKTCPTLISQMRNYVWDRKKLDKPVKTNDDLTDALRYLCHSHRMESQVQTTPLKLPERPKRVNF